MMNWKELKDEIYYWDGSWRDIYVYECKLEDWKKWVELVNANYRIDWYNGETETNKDSIDFDVILDYWNNIHDCCSTAKVFIDDIQINTHFFDNSEIENDIDPREFKSIDDHNKLIDYMTKISIKLNKPIFLTPENSPKTTLLTVHGNKVLYCNSTI